MLESLVDSNGTTTGSNDFWKTVGDLATRVIDYKTRSQTTAAPSGAPVGSNANPWFGNWNPFPQAQTKAQPGAGGNVLSLVGPVLLGIGVLLLVFAFARR